MYKHFAGLLVFLMIAIPGAALGQDDDDEPIDLDLEVSKPPPAKAPPAPAKAAETPAAAEEVGDDDLDLEEERAGLTNFDPKLQLDEPGVLPPGSQGPVSVPASPVALDRGAERRAWPLWPSLAAAGVAVVTLGVGIRLVSIDGTGTDCEGEPLPDLRNCAEVYATGDAGYALTAVGIASLAAGGLFLYLFLANRPGEKEEDGEGIASLGLVPDGRGGLMVGASGWF